MARRWILIVLLGALTGCGVGRPPPEADGEHMYALLCANCHGAELEGRIGPPLGPDSNSARQPDSFLETTILHGRGRMPSFRSSLDSDQVDRLIGFIREVQGG